MICGTCGANQNSGPGYLVKRGNQEPRYYSDYSSINQSLLTSKDTTLIKVNRSNLDSQLGQIKKGKAFTDPEFSPNETALGIFDSVNIDRWKRVSQVAAEGKLFASEIEPKQAISSQNQKEKGFQAAVACLAQKPSRIKNIFDDEKYSNNGVYTMFLRHKGEIQQVVVDNYIPVNQSSEPIFSKPSNNSTWMMILEKGRAKLYGNYEKMVKNSNNVKACLQQLTFAPTENYKTQITNKDDLWDKIIEGAKNNRPMIGYTSASHEVNWLSVSLTPNHYYTIVDAAVLVHKLGSVFKVIKLRNAFKNEEYAGEGSKSDTLFWDQIEGSEEKSRILSSVGSKQGIIYMLYADYLKHFENTFINQVQDHTKYVNEEIFFGQGEHKHGVIYRFYAQKEGDYVISVDQNDMVSAKTDNPSDGWGRTTILLVKDLSNNMMEDYQYIDGCLKYNEQHPSLKVHIPPGKYIIYLKIDPTLQSKSFPTKVNMVVYSLYATSLKVMKNMNNSEVIRRVFLTHGRNNKRQFYNNDLMWSAWKLVPRGGYAYLVFGNDEKSQFKFVVKVDKEMLYKQNYVIKSPQFEEVIKTLEVLPGKEEIILLRICNSEVRDINFPPPIDLKILPIL